ncbi:hypothetical protein N658DRAFT_328914 [Parathielavia hyrcaniae]|uniref:Uncharacterized protein n=1 Tax=Parathielavia hyrcaniae TaxID=113614 RepID=A0AAN6T3Q5_9PEZI|nr:hypothetical protein N658DRAFT_328914 [Parathielavia hyrcaniae]
MKRRAASRWRCQASLGGRERNHFRTVRKSMIVSHETAAEIMSERRGSSTSPHMLCGLRHSERRIEGKNHSRGCSDESCLNLFGLKEFIVSAAIGPTLDRRSEVYAPLMTLVQGPSVQFQERLGRYSRPAQFRGWLWRAATANRCRNGTGGQRNSGAWEPTCERGMQVSNQSRYLSLSRRPTIRVGAHKLGGLDEG